MIAPLLLLLAIAQARMPEGAGEASNAFVQCGVREAESRSSGQEPAAAIAEAALAACAVPMQHLWDVYDAALGTLSAAEREALVAPLRQGLVRIVEERRRQIGPERNETTALRDCILAEAPAAARPPGPMEEMVDRLLGRCRAAEEAMRAALVRQGGEQSAARIMPSIQPTLRSLARRQIELARARR
jgi:hypothetical protein